MKDTFINDEKLLNKVVRKDDKFFHPFVVPQPFVKHFLHHMHDVLHHNVCIVGKAYKETSILM